MKLQLKRPFVIFDLETTGISISTDRIVELAYIKVMPDGAEFRNTLRFNPEMPIPIEASLIHGIYDADVANEPTFAERASYLAEQFQGCDFGGFNSNKFDFPMLVEAFLRAEVPFDTDNRKFVDAQRIFHMMEQRTLTAAYKFYCQKNLENAHSAMADTEATYEVLMAQLDRYDALQNTVDFLNDFTGRGNAVDLAGRMIYNEQKVAVFNFGKHKGKSVLDVLKNEPAYYQWIMDNDFPLETKRKLTQLKLSQFGK